MEAASLGRTSPEERRLCTGEIMEENSASIRSHATFSVAVITSLDCDRGELYYAIISNATHEAFVTTS